MRNKKENRLQTDRQKDRKTERQKNRKTERQKDRKGISVCLKKKNHEQLC